MKLLHAALFALLVLFVNSLTAQSTLTAEKRGRLDSFFLVLEKNGKFNGGVTVVEKGTVIYKRSAGYANFETGTLHSDTTPFNLASVSKPLTALAVLQLVQKNRLQLEDPFNRFFPDFPYAGITIRNLLNHTSGLPQLERMEQAYISGHPYEIITNQKVYAHLVDRKDSLIFQTGSSWRYNNLNYLLLALLVEKLSGMSFADYMARHIFRPAGMKHSFVRSATGPNTTRYIYPTWYDTTLRNVDSLDPEKVYTYYHLGGMYGPGNVVSTMQDLVKFERALFSGKVVKLSLLKDALTPLVLNNGKPFQMRGNRSYGLGWNIIQEPAKDTTVFHDGHIVGITAMFIKNLTKEQTVIFYDNTDAAAGPFLKVGSVLRILNDQPLNRISLRKSVARQYGAALVHKGADYAVMKLHELRMDTANYYLDELEMNSLGYDLLGKPDFPNHIELSVEVFKNNTLLYRSANSFDSYGDALMKAGRKEEAMLAYTTSLAMDPNNSNAKRNLEILRK